MLIPIKDETIELVRLLNKYGMSIYDVTPRSSSGMRQEEIISWMSNRDDIESFVVIDDDIVDLKKFDGKELIKTNFYDKDGISGLSKCHIEKAVNILNKNKDKKLVKKIII